MKKLLAALVLLVSCLDASAAKVLVSSKSIPLRKVTTSQNKIRCPESTENKCVVKTYIDTETGDLSGAVGESLVIPDQTETDVTNPGYADAQQFSQYMENTLENGGELEIQQ
jgi:hypothetical protein